MTAYKATRALTPDEIRFNQMLSKCRTSIERAFCLLKGKFRRLKFIENVLPKLISNVIMGSCILHNICIRDDDFNARILSEYVDDAMNFNEDTEEDDEYLAGDEETAVLKRDDICNRIANFVLNF